MNLLLHLLLSFIIQINGEFIALHVPTTDCTRSTSKRTPTATYYPPNVGIPMATTRIQSLVIPPSQSTLSNQLLKSKPTDVPPTPTQSTLFAIQSQTKSNSTV